MKSDAVINCVTFRHRGHVTVFPSNAGFRFPQCGQLAMRIGDSIFMENQRLKRPVEATSAGERA
jgi:hypothetical protein